MKSISYFNTENTLIEPLFNDMFLRLFGTKDSKNLTRSLVNSVLKAASLDEISEIDSISAEHTLVGGAIGCKSPRCDVLITSENRLLDLEAQCYPCAIDERSLFYAAKALVTNTPSHTAYSEIPQVIVITLLDARPRFPEDPDYLHVCRMQWNDGRETTKAVDKQIFILLELSKIRKRYTSLEKEVLNNDLLSWLYLLTNGFKEQQEAETIMDAFPTIQEFAEKYGIALNDPKLKQAYEEFEEAEREYAQRQIYLKQIEEEAKKKAWDEAWDEAWDKSWAEAWDKSWAEAWDKSWAEAANKTQIDTLAKSVKALMTNMKIDAETAMGALSISDDLKPVVLKEISE